MGVRLSIFWLLVLTSMAIAKPLEIKWDKATQRLIEPGALYGRMIRLQSGAILCCYEKGGASWTKISRNEGLTWSAAVLVAKSDFGAAANPEIMQLKNGDVLLFFNLRPRDGQSDKKHAFAIGMARSRDEGASWQMREAPLYEAGTTFENGCWEPCARQLPSGEILLFFADEGPYTKSNEQQISLMISRDNGDSWDAPRAFSFRKGHRDGMPVPLLLPDGGLAVAIEDNGLTPDNHFKPVIIYAPRGYDWNAPPVDAESPRRWAAVERWPANVYAGAPYLIRLPNGVTLLSVQSDEGRAGAPQMVVYVGDERSQNFASPSVPFGLSEGVKGQWNSLFARSENAVTALTSARLEGTFGLWAIDGKVSTP
jgi:hypothetical protein